MIDSQRLLARFLRYVAIDTTANESESAYPSSPGQLTLGKLIADELRELGLSDVEHDPHGLVWGTVPSNVADETPTIAFNAHLDTSPETSGTNVRPQVIRNYRGGDIPLPAVANQIIRVASNPELATLIGKTLITTDGTTLLGADDKAGLAVIVELAAMLLENPQVPHGPVRILFTCDEEIGRGADHVDLTKLAATVCYTLDGQGANDLDVETFSADQATVTVQGVNIHPSIGKDRMVNALRAGGMFLDRLPRAGLSPETTEGRQGFLHPYHAEGGVAQFIIKLIIRDFETARLAEHADRLRTIACEVEAASPGIRIDVATRPQYRNLGDGLAREPRAVAYAAEAHRRLGREPNLTIIRGGTDGSLLTERGLPTPNLSTGQHNPHSPLEWACLEEMVLAAELLVEITRVWAEQR